MDKHFSANGRRIVIAISDVAWRGAVLITEFGVEEINPLMAKCDGFFDTYELIRESHALDKGQLSDAVCACWAEWSRHARKSFRRRTVAWNDIADVSIGALLLASSDARRELADIAVSGDVPVLAIAVNSAQTRLKCNVRAVALSLPNWICASGAVAGRA